GPRRQAGYGRGGARPGCGGEAVGNQMRAVAVLLFVTACTERNPSYCNSNAECGSGSCDVASHTCLGVGGAGGTGGSGGMAMCSGDDQCHMPTPRCVSGN